jgi:hypothetical protein
MEISDLRPFYVLDVLAWSPASDQLTSILFCGNAKIRQGFRVYGLACKGMPSRPSKEFGNAAVNHFQVEILGTLEPGMTSRELWMNIIDPLFMILGLTLHEP